VSDFWRVDIGMVTTALLLVLTLSVYVYQYRAMMRQVAVAQESSRVHSLLTVISLLQEEDVRQARWWVMDRLAAKPFPDWDDTDTQRASRACSRFDLIGVIGQMAVFPVEVVTANWAPAIRRTYEVTAEFRSALKAKNGSEYWSGFDWLYERTGSRSLTK
jgi:hypothetical protein